MQPVWLYGLNRSTTLHREYRALTVVLATPIKHHGLGHSRVALVLSVQHLVMLVLGPLLDAVLVEPSLDLVVELYFHGHRPLLWSLLILVCDGVGPTCAKDTQKVFHF